MADPLAPVVTTEMNYLVGSNEAAAGFPGTAHAVEHMMFRGSPGLSADQLAYVSSAMGGEFNADTQQTVTQYFFTVPAEDLDVALRLEATRMRGLLPDDALWQRERGAIEQEVSRDLSNPEYQLYTQLLEALFRATPYAHDALGTRPSFELTTGADLRRFHDTWYAPNDAVLVVAGDVRPARVLDQVRAIFGDIPARPLPPRPEIRLRPVEPTTLRLDTDLPYGLAVVAYRLPGSASPEWAAARVLSDVLSSRRGDLYALVPAGKALYAGFQAEGLPAASVGFALAAFPAGASGDEVLRQVREVLAAARVAGVSPELVEVAKRRELTQHEFERNSVSGLAEAWSRARQLVVRDLEALRRAPATAGELRAAKAALLRAVQLEESSTSRIAAGMLHRVREERPLDEPTRAARRWLALSARDVQAAFRRWIRPADLVQVVEGPAPR